MNFNITLLSTFSCSLYGTNFSMSFLNFSTLSIFITSPLFKSAVFGGDPNWGRIVSAIGYSGADVSADTVTIAIANKQDEVDLVKDGEILAFEGTDNLLRAEKIMLGEEVIVNVDLNKGDGEATAWGCDLSYDYVKINAEYTT